MRGFISVVLVLGFIALLGHVLAIHAKIAAGSEAIKNDLVLLQAINERTYELEDGFAWIVKENLGPNSEGACSAVESWMDRFPYDHFVGYVDPDTYAPFIPRRCSEVLYFDAEDGSIKVKEKDPRKGVPTKRLAFRWNVSVHDARFLVLVPESTVVK